MPAELTSLGVLELSSIGVAMRVEDAMLKAADVTLLVARTICSGKYVIMIGSDVAAVESSLAAGKAVADEALIDELLLPEVDPRVFPAISGTVELSDADRDALGILEAFSVTSIVEAADAAVKAASVKLFRIHVAMAIGGKGFLLLCGPVDEVQAAIEAGTLEIARRGLLVSRVVIPRPAPQLWSETF